MRLLSSTSIKWSEPTRGPPYTSKMTEASYTRHEVPILPTYRILDTNGQVIDPQEDPKVAAAASYMHAFGGWPRK